MNNHRQNAHITIHTSAAKAGDGSSGFAALVRDQRSRDLITITGGQGCATVHNMELRAIAKALAELNTDAAMDAVSATICPTSDYIAEVFMDQLPHRWRSNSWKDDAGQEVPYADLWNDILNNISNRECNFAPPEGHDAYLAQERCNISAQQSAELTAATPEPWCNTGRMRTDCQEATHPMQHNNPADTILEHNTTALTALEQAMTLWKQGNPAATADKVLKATRQLKQQRELLAIPEAPAPSAHPKTLATAR